MTTHFFNRLSTVAVAMLLGAGGPNVCAQVPARDQSGYPSKPIRWIIPFPPGGPSDVVARIIGPRLGERLKQPVIVDHRPGAFGIIGMEAAAGAAPDGHTIFFGTSNEVINPVLRKLRFDPRAQLAAVSQLATITFVLLAAPDFAPRTVPEVLTEAKAKPGAVSCGFGAPVFQLACELLRTKGKLDIIVVPYKGVSLALNDLIGKQVQLTFVATNIALPAVKAGRVTAIATVNPRRGQGPFGELPTINETLPGFELESWFGVLAPVATPREIIARLNREIAAVLEEDEVRKRLTDGGLEVSHGSPEAFAEIMRRDYAKFSKIIEDAGIKAE